MAKKLFATQPRFNVGLVQKTCTTWNPNRSEQKRNGLALRATRTYSITGLLSSTSENVSRNVGTTSVNNHRQSFLANDIINCATHLRFSFSFRTYTFNHGVGTAALDVVLRRFVGQNLLNGRKRKRSNRSGRALDFSLLLLWAQPFLPASSLINNLL